MTSDIRRQIIEGAIAPPKCLDCAYYGGPSKLYVLGLTCKAYPDGIPETILTGKHDHANPLPGDHGIQFKEQDEAHSVPQCFDCKYFRRGRRRDLASTCDAFPGGIPLPIFPKGGDHTKPYPGDHGIQFKRVNRRKGNIIGPFLMVYGGLTLVFTIIYSWKLVFLLIAELIAYNWFTRRR